MKNIYLQTDKGVVDILTPFWGSETFIDANAEELEVDDYKYKVISLPDLITAKEAMGREKDPLTAKELRALAAKRDQVKEHNFLRSKTRRVDSQATERRPRRL